MRRANGFLLAAAAAWLPGSASAGSATPVGSCGTIARAGAYELAGNLVAKRSCLLIAASYVTLDLGGFSIIGPGGSSNTSVGIAAAPAAAEGIEVRNGTIEGFGTGVDLSAAGGSVVEKLRVFGTGGSQAGIIATGVVRDNVVVGIGPEAEKRRPKPEGETGEPGASIAATGLISGNYVQTGTRTSAIVAGAASTVVGNTVQGSSYPGFTAVVVQCPSNVTGNTILYGFTNLELVGTGCKSLDNVAPPSGIP